MTVLNVFSTEFGGYSMFVIDMCRCSRATIIVMNVYFAVINPFVI